MNKIIASTFLFFSLLTQAQDVDFNLKSSELSASETYLVLDHSNESRMLKTSQAWFLPEKFHLVNNESLSKQLKDPLNSFVIPVADIVEKGVVNYRLVVCRGKSTNVLPRSKDKYGFFEGATSLNIIASVYVDPTKINSDFLAYYVSALSNLMRNVAMYENDTKKTEILKNGFWYPELQTVHFEQSDLDSTMGNKNVLSSIMTKARLYETDNINAAASTFGPDDLIADILEIKQKGGKSEIHRFFFSSTKGIVYHEAESAATRKDKIFTKRDIFNYNVPDARGKK